MPIDRDHPLVGTPLVFRSHYQVIPDRDCTLLGMYSCGEYALVDMPAPPTGSVMKAVRVAELRTTDGRRLEEIL